MKNVVFLLVLQSCTVKEVQMKSQAMKKKIEELSNFKRSVSETPGEVMQIPNALIDLCFRPGKPVRAEKGTHCG